MSRSPTSFNAFSQPTVPIQPVATPTDQFARPLVVPRGGGEAMALAQSLSYIQPQLAHILDNEAAGSEQAARQAAQADFAQRRYANIEAFRQLVKSGQIPAARSPWYTHETEKLFATERATQSYAQAQADYQQNAALRGSDDPRPVSDFFQQRMSEAMKGANPWEVEAMLPIAEQAVVHGVAQHNAYREQMRPLEHAAALNQNFGSILASHGVDSDTFDQAAGGKDAMGNPIPPEVQQAAQAKIEKAKGDIAALYENESKVMLPVQAKAMLKDAATQASLWKADSRIFSTFYSDLPNHDGGPLDNSPAAQSHLKDLTVQIGQRQLELKRNAYESKALDDQTNLRDARIGWSKFTEQQLAKNKDWNVWDASTQEVNQYVQTLPPAVRSQFETLLSQEMMARAGMLDTAHTQQAKTYLSDNATRIANGDWTKDPTFRQAAIATVLKLQDPSLLHTVLPLAMAADRQWAPQTSPDAMRAIGELRSSGKPVTLDAVNDLLAQYPGQFAQADARDLYNVVGLQHGAARQDIYALEKDSADQLRMQMLGRFVDESLAKKTVSENVLNLMQHNRPAAKDAAVQEAAGSWAFLSSYNVAKSDLARLFSGYNRDPDAVKLAAEDPEAFRQKVQADVDKIATANRGYTSDQYRQSVDRAVKEYQTIHQPETAPAPTAPSRPVTPGTPEAYAVEGTLLRLLPQHASVSMPVQESINDALRNVPAGVASEVKEKLAPPKNPEERWSYFADPHRLDYVGQLSQLRDQLNHFQRFTPAGLGGEAGYATLSDNSAAGAVLQAKYDSSITEARRMARRLENQIPPGVEDIYKNLLSTAVSVTGKDGKPSVQLQPSAWMQARQMENKRIDAIMLRQAAGYYPDEVKAMIDAGDAKAWMTHPLYTNMSVFDKSPANMATILKDMRTLGLITADKAKNQQAISSFIDAQQALTARLTTQQ